MNFTQAMPWCSGKPSQLEIGKFAEGPKGRARRKSIEAGVCCSVIGRGPFPTVGDGPGSFQALVRGIDVCGRGLVSFAKGLQQGVLGGSVRLVQRVNHHQRPLALRDV